MPAQNLHRENKEGIYSHIYNKGVEKRIIFNDEEDYEVFQGYLKDYLTAPKDPESIKKAFTVHGRIFRGTPHQPKNYFNKVDLLAYNLQPDHFHLLLHQKTQNSLQGFIRSLCTRYSMYFNKKYKHTGALFEGPYKSVQIKDEALLLLTRYLHKTGDYSTYPEYLRLRDTPWVSTGIVLSIKNKEGNYKNFVEKYELDQNEKVLLEEIAIENVDQHLEGRHLASDEAVNILDADVKQRTRLPEFVAVSSVIFVLLVTLGIRNIVISNSNNPVPSAEILGKTDRLKPENMPEATSEAIPKTPPKAMLEEQLKDTVKVRIDDNSSHVNIRQKPTASSEKIGQANNGDTFEFVSLDSEWYQVKLSSGSAGFISAKYIVKEE